MPGIFVFFALISSVYSSRFSFSMYKKADFVKVIVNMNYKLVYVKEQLIASLDGDIPGA